jgi:hypothetical protein
MKNIPDRIKKEFGKNPLVNETLQSVSINFDFIQVLYVNIPSSKGISL